MTAPGTRGSRGRGLVLLAATVAVVVVAVLLTRGGTAATEADLRPPPPPTPSETTDEMALVVDEGGIPGARLGQEVIGPEVAGWVAASGRGGVPGRCDVMFAGADVQRGPYDILAWRLDDRIVSIVVVPSEDPVPRGLVVTTQGPELGDTLERAALLPGAEIATEELISEQPDRLRVITVPHGGTETLYSDLGRQDGIAYVEVREPVAARCELADVVGPVARVPSGSPTEPVPTGPPDLTPDGRGDVSFGRPAEELVELGVLERPQRSDVGGGVCALYYPGPLLDAQDPHAGLGTVFARDGLVVGIALWGGRTSEGLAVGDLEARAAAVYPQLLDAEGQLLQGRSVELADGRRVLVRTGRGAVVPRTVDTWVTTEDQTVQEITVYTEDCGA